MTTISDLHRRWRKDAGYQGAYDALGEEFDPVRALIQARTAAGLSQSQLARRMKTSQACNTRIEGGKVRPSTDALERFAQATRTRRATGWRSGGQAAGVRTSPNSRRRPAGARGR